MVCGYEIECAGCKARLPKRFSLKNGILCPQCGSRDAGYADGPRRFEEDHPDEAKVLERICAERMSKRIAQKHRPLKPIYVGREPVVRGAPKVGRNDPCACGSGRKFKKCCM